MPSGTPVRFRGSAVILGLCILLTCMMVVWLMMIANSEPWAWSLREELLTSSRHSGPKAPADIWLFGASRFLHRFLHRFWGRFWTLFWTKIRLFFHDFLNQFSSSVFWLILDAFFVTCLYLRCLKITFLLQKNNYFQGFTCVLKVMIFIIVLFISN